MGGLLVGACGGGAGWWGGGVVGRRLGEELQCTVVLGFVGHFSWRGCE